MERSVRLARTASAKGLATLRRVIGGGSTGRSWAYPDPYIRNPDIGGQTTWPQRRPTLRSGAGRPAGGGGGAELRRDGGPGRDPRDLDGPAPGGRHRQVGPPEVQRDGVARTDLVSLR